MSSAMGGTGRAGLGSSEGAFVNPAVIPLARNYEFNIFYRDGYESLGQHRQGWMVGAVDNTESVLFPGSLHYGRLRDTGRAGAPVDGEVWHAAGAYLISQRLSVGASAYRLHHKVKNDRSFEQWNGSLGSVLLINEAVALAYTLDNLAKPSGDTPVGLREDLRQGVGGFFRAVGMVVLRADITREEKYNPDKKLTYMLGMESATSEYFVVRLGYRHHERMDKTIWSGGFAFNGPRLRFDYALEKDQEGDSGAMHSVDLRIPF
ncbi:MAG TPA: hypothetical protein PKC28_07840 [Bdellovibrionales bacterium]|nr:hypothetical protein [Bdellovibrionales bacterium]